MKKQSLLSLLNSRYPLKTNEENYALIISGNVFVDDEKIRDPVRKIYENSFIEITKKKYVSRGGFKLEHALSCFKIDIAGRIIIDAGSSTGGFTDCLLQHGAKAVHSVDVGFNLLDYSLRIDRRIIVHEKTNIMNISNLDPPAHIGTADLSFRSITAAASKILDLVTEKTLIALIKPQFEAKNRNFLNKGIIKDTVSLKNVLINVINDLISERSFIKDIEMSPIPGRKGNIEFLFLIVRECTDNMDYLLTKIDNLLEKNDSQTIK